VIIADYYHEVVYSVLPFIPEWIIPIISIIIVVSIIVMFWYREHKNELMKQEFITVITHKFRTPITGIKWAIQMLKNDVTYEVKDDLLKEMERASQRIMEIVDLVTGFAKFDSRLQYAFSYVSIRSLVDASLSKYSQWIRDKKMGFNIESSEFLPPLYLDKSKIQFVLDILMENAIKYSAVGGLISMRISENKSKHTLLFSIQDSGIGMSPEELRMVFRRFWRSEKARTVDTEGMGLGLHTAKNIMDHHDARIWAESKGTGQGTTFYLQFKVK
jgi:signal transduction histidine kinase